MPGFEDNRPTIASFRWNSADWIEVPVKDGNLVWKNDRAELAIQKFAWEVPTGLPREWRDPKILTAYLLDNCSPRVSVVSIEVLPIGERLFCAQYITKEFLAPPSLGLAYMGMVTIPFREFFCNIAFISQERGMTGFRETTLIMAGKVKLPEMREREDAPVIINKEALEAWLRKGRDGVPRRLASDDPQWDALFPVHPLSRVRAHLRRFHETLKIDASVLGHPLFGP